VKEMIDRAVQEFGRLDVLVRFFRLSCCEVVRQRG
jgi:hypothetical protein